MAITGSQPSYMYALGGYARGGATRGGDTDPQTYITIAGVHVGAVPAVTTQYVLGDSLSIVETEGETPNTASFQVKGFQPTDGQEVIITQGSKNNLDRLFAGTILTDAHHYVGTPANYNEQINAIDYTWQLTRRTISQKWTSTSATTIAQAIIANCPGFSSVSVASGLATLDEFTVTNQTLAAALSALCDRIGATWKATYASTVSGMRADVRLAITNDTTLTDPTTLTAASALLTGMSDFSVTRDLSPVITRQPVEGGGGTALADVAVGATTLPISEALWYNAAGGTVATGPQRVTYTGLGYGYTSELSTWHAQATSQLTRTWTGVVWAEALGLFVAVSGNSDLTAVMTSPDGFVWTTRVPAVASTWEAVAWSSTLSLLVAVSANGLVMTSPDGITWAQPTAADNSAWQDVVWAPTLALFVAVAKTAGTGTFQVMTSPDGVTWTGRAAANTNQWTSITWSPSLGLLVAVAASNAATNAVMTSTNGTAWTARTISGAWFHVAWSPTLSLFVAVAGTSTATSPDGITWTNHASALPSANWNALVWAESGFFVAISDGTSSNIAVSPDGLTWTLYTGPSNASGGRWAVTWSASLARLVAVGFTGALAGTLMTNSGSAYRTLTGIPASGAGSILYAIKAGDPVNLRVVIDDTSAQAVVAALMLPTVDDGIIEGPVIKDGRISETEARARGTAQLALRSAIDTAVTYSTRDKNTHASRTIAVSLGAPTSVSSSFKLQSVTIDTFTPALWPIAHAHGANKRVTFEDLLRTVKGA